MSLACIYCDKEYSKENALKSHTGLCKYNPLAAISLDKLRQGARDAAARNKGKVQFNKATVSCMLCRTEVNSKQLTNHYNGKTCKKAVDKKAALGITRTVVCEYCKATPRLELTEHLAICRANPDNKKGKYVWTAERRKRRSAVMKKAVKDNPESYSSANRGRTKQQVVDGISLQGQWEVDFYLWAKEQGLEPKRPEGSFPYTWKGERQYFPDFYISSLDLYVEVKGYETDRDRAKWNYFPHSLCVVKKKEIEQIRKGCFGGLSPSGLRQQTHNLTVGGSNPSSPTKAP